MPAPYRIVTVCTGNICRSPMAEYLLAEALADAGLAEDVVVESAGVSSEEAGNPMDSRALAALRRHGHEAPGSERHTARRFERDWFDGVDLVLAADGWHQRSLRRLARDEEQASRVALLRSFDPQAVADGELDIDDPWYGPASGFDRTYAEIAAAVPGIVDFVRRELGTRRVR